MSDEEEAFDSGFADADNNNNNNEGEADAPAKKRARRGAAAGNLALYAEFRKLPEKYKSTASNKVYDTHYCICKHCEAAQRAAHPDATDVVSLCKKINMVHRDCRNHLKSCMHYQQACVVEGREAVFFVEKSSSSTDSSSNNNNGNASSAKKASASNNNSFPPIKPSAIWPSTFEVFVEKDTFKFNAAHFVAFEGYRERLHGHNYRVGVRLQGNRTHIGPDGYVIDYGNIKKVCKDICKDLNEHFLCPMYSDVLHIVQNTETGVVRIECAVDGTHFEFPAADCKMLPIMHATTEELAIYLWSQVVERLDAGYLKARGMSSLELTVAEAPGQQATFRYPIPSSSSFSSLDVRHFIQTGQVIPMPCLEDDRNKKNNNQSCQCPSTSQLTSLTAAMHAQGLLTRQVSPEELQALMTVNGSKDAAARTV